MFTTISRTVTTGRSATDKRTAGPGFRPGWLALSSCPSFIRRIPRFPIFHGDVVDPLRRSGGGWNVNNERCMSRRRHSQNPHLRLARLWSDDGWCGLLRTVMVPECRVSGVDIPPRSDSQGRTSQRIRPIASILAESYVPRTTTPSTPTSVRDPSRAWNSFRLSGAIRNAVLVISDGSRPISRQ